MNPKKYLVDVTITTTKTMEVLAANREEASIAIRLWTTDDILADPAKTRTKVKVSTPDNPNEPTFM